MGFTSFTYLTFSLLMCLRHFEPRSPCDMECPLRGSRIQVTGKRVLSQGKFVIYWLQFKEKSARIFTSSGRILVLQHVQEITTRFMGLRLPFILWALRLRSNEFEAGVPNVTPRYPVTSYPSIFQCCHLPPVLNSVTIKHVMCLRYTRWANSFVKFLVSKCRTYISSL